MLLLEVLDLLCSERSISKITAQQYRRSVVRFSDFLKVSAKIEHLDYSTVNGYLQWLESQNLSAGSVRNHRIGIICVWNFCVWPLELVKPFQSRRIRCPKLRRKPVAAWGIDDVVQLANVARSVPGTLKNGLPAGLLLESWVRLGVETGLRPGDLRLLTWDHVSLEECKVSTCQHKTGSPIVCRFSEKTRSVLKELKRFRFSNIFPIGKAGIWKWEQRLFRLADRLRGFRRQHGQGLGVLRKTHCTEIFKRYGLAAAAESLGHRSGTKIVRDHYIDSGATAQSRLKLA
jgi:integrase